MNDQPCAPAMLMRDNAPPVVVTGNCSLGRAVGNDVVLVDDRVSRRHATVHAQGEQEFWLVDLGSRNGTYLNGRRVSQPTRIRDGDRIQIGPFTLSFHFATAHTHHTGTVAPAEQTQVDMRSIPCWLLLCDIMGSSVLSRERPPEEVAMLVGGWFARCKEVIEDNGGSINKYLGDALFAYWPARDPALPHVAQTLRDLARMQSEKRPPFRVVVHHGSVLLGGIPSSGEESLAGPEVNFLFRQEKLAGGLGHDRMSSHAAASLLGPLVPHESVGAHPLPGFEGTFEFHAFRP